MYKSIFIGAAIAIMGFAALKTINEKKPSATALQTKAPVITGWLNDSLVPIIPTNVSGYKGLTVTKKSNPVSFSSALDNDYYRTDTINRHAFLYIDTHVGEFINDNATKVPLNLSIVIDRSGSMSGDKIKYAKNAASYVIDQLQSNDYVSLVIYDHAVELLQAPVLAIDKASLKKKINSIFPGGSTNLWGGTEKGYEQVKTNYKQNYINRVLLLSDGLANAGLTDQKAIALKVQQHKDKDGITLSTFGIGLNYNETLMTDMAETGAGNYYFIESPDKLAGIFSKELNGLMNVAAQNTVLKVKIPQGVTVQKVYNSKYTVKGDELQFFLRDLFANDSKGIMLYCKIDDNTYADLKFISTLQFTKTENKEMVTLENENLLHPMPSYEIYANTFNEKVIQQAILNQANENMEKALVATDEGNYNKARMITNNNNNFLKSNAKYVSQSPELKKLEAVTVSYSTQMADAETMSTDDKNRMQKASKENNYKIRTKKQ